VIIQAFCNVAKLDFLRGVHQPDDDYRMALYRETATLDKATERYTTDGEIAGPGYEAGGQPLAGIQVDLSGDDAFITWDDPVWPNATIEADGALIYNASRGDRALEVLRFENAPVRSTNGPFRVPLPAPGATAVLRIN
jgi:hypothetical protein